MVFDLKKPCALQDMACFQWATMLYAITVPTPFRELMETLLPSGELRDAIEHLLWFKQSGEELAWGPRIPVLSDWIKTELARLAEGPAALTPPVIKPDPEPLNALFRARLAEETVG